MTREVTHCAADACTRVLSDGNVTGYCKHHWRRVSFADKLAGAERDPRALANRLPPRGMALAAPRGAVPEPDPLLTVTDIARFLRCSNRTVRRMLRDGRLRGLRRAPTSPWLVTRAALDDFVNRSMLATDNRGSIQAAVQHVVQAAHGDPPPPPGRLVDLESVMGPRAPRGR